MCEFILVMMGSCAFVRMSWTWFTVSFPGIFLKVQGLQFCTSFAYVKQGFVRAMAYKLPAPVALRSNLTNVKQKLLLLYVRSFQWRSYDAEVAPEKMFLPHNFSGKSFDSEPYVRTWLSPSRLSCLPILRKVKKRWSKHV